MSRVLETPDRFLLTEEEQLGKIDVLLGGRASEQVFFGEEEFKALAGVPAAAAS